MAQNLLSNSRFEAASTDPWAAPAGTTLSRSTVVDTMVQGDASLQITADAMSATATRNITHPPIPCTAGEVFSAEAWTRRKAGSVQRTVTFTLQFLNASGAQVSNVIAQQQVSLDTGFVFLGLTNVSAPSGATQVRFQFRVTNMVAGDVHYLDDVWLNRGATVDRGPLAVIDLTTSGTWTCPAGVNEIVVEARGSGGGGGAGSLLNGGGSGGGSGAYGRRLMTTTPGTTYQVTVPAGGAGAAYQASTPGGNGAAASFGAGASLVLGAGGSGGTSAPSGSFNGGVGGTVANSTGSTRLFGYRGGNGQSNGTPGIGAGASLSFPLEPLGGPDVAGGTPGSPGSVPGGGGGGGGNAGGGAGGNGARGQVRITTYAIAAALPLTVWDGATEKQVTSVEVVNADGTTSPVTLSS